MSKRVLSCSMLFVILVPSLGLAQWATQKISLKPGWNAVYLEVEPDLRSCEAVFAGLPIQAVWAWNRRFTTVQFIQDPTVPVPEQPEWLTYTPGSSTTTNLHILQGGHTYLVQFGGSTSVPLSVTGKPVARPIQWMGDSFNLVGFPVDPDHPPTFTQFLAASPAHAGQPVYRLGANREWEPIAELSTETIRAGEAYWVYCQGPSDYSGPLKLSLQPAGMLDFGRVQPELTLGITNLAGVGKQVSLHAQPLAPQPGSKEQAKPPFSYRDLASSTQEWIQFPELLQVSIEPGQELDLQIQIDRKEIGATYESLLEVLDGQGYLVRIPITARGNISYAGLWVGTASVSEVSFAASPSDSNTPRSTATEFPVRLILHVDEKGKARLLQQATLMWKEGTLKADPTDAKKKIVDEAGRYVIVTRDDLASQFSGAALRDGKPFGRRISSSAFACSAHPMSSKFPLDLEGAFNQSLKSAEIILYYDDPLNPFKHKYHPDHDNLDYDFKTVLPEGIESYTITRKIKLTFSDVDLEGLQLAGWGDNQVGGIYQESIQGVHKRVLNVEGTFRLHQVSRVAVLNDGL